MIAILVMSMIINVILMYKDFKQGLKIKALEYEIIHVEIAIDRIEQKINPPKGGKLWAK